MAPDVRSSPAKALRVVAQALGGRVSIPLSTVHERLGGVAGDVDLTLEAAGRGIRVRGEAHALGAPIEFGAKVDATGIFIDGLRRTIQLRLSEVELATPDDAPGPLADAIRNRMLDLDNPATLIGNMISLPDMVVGAEGQVLVIDLMKTPAMRRDETLRTAFAAVTSLLCVVDIGTADDSIVLRLGLVPGGPKEAALSAARAALTPIVRYLWPEGRS